MAYLVVPVVPIANEHGDVPIWLIEWHRDHVAVVDGDSPVAAGCSLEASGREVEVAADLVLHLELIRPIPAGRNGAVGAQHSILP